ncbi:hypothetical protein PghCCS26_47850 [Paenibacillus glycanilyticus]|uniref:Phage tail protein n=1 Tax=Paenibacillus glycanilyticus TaxID=126569 RepID=A0ABQ6NUA7_9BACL|nr:hypothetical protein [Paenibacillus glycanilyticus]GMK47655.1 hypothetical protein PghCCS26_47850 [Paenibacillus glycanilyticus]
MSTKFDVKALRDKALQTDDIKNGSVYVEEWDADFPVRSLTGKGLKDVLTKSKNAKGERDEIRMSLLAAIVGCADETGARVFDDTDLAVFESDSKSAAPILKIGKAVLDLSALGNNAQTDAKKS